MAMELDPEGIVYLRPQTEKAIALLDIVENKPYEYDTPPPPEPADIRLEGIPERIPSTYLSPHVGHGPSSNISRESSPGPYSVHPRVLRLGFDTDVNHATRGYYFGSLPDSNIQMPYFDKGSAEGCYFRIHYNFDSGALLLTAMSKMKIGSTILRPNESLLLMADTLIDCGKKSFQFLVEFPDLSQCSDEHEANYREYVDRLRIPDAPYMATTREQDPPIGQFHKSKAILGKGSFGEVHKAVHTRTGGLCAIKMLTGEEGIDDLHEVRVLSKLSHPNIVQYRDAFMYKGHICIIMELAANDLLKHRDARKGGRRTSYLPMRCVRSIAQQTLSAIEYLHDEGYTHRDLKPQNILVTEWDPKEDLPTVKLTDFGLAGMKTELSSLCGTPEYWAPEIEAEMARKEKRRDRAARGFKTVERPFFYHNSVDIWALGKILNELLEDVPAQNQIRGKSMPINKEPAMQMIRNMMQEAPGKRPSASQCLQYPWMVNDKPSATKRDRSLTPSSSFAMPHKRLAQSASGSPNIGKGSTEVLMELLFSDSHSLDIEPVVNQSCSNLDARPLKQIIVPSDLLKVSHVTENSRGEGHLNITAQYHDGGMVSGSIVNRSNNGAVSISVDRGAVQGSSAALEARTESGDRRGMYLAPIFDDPNITTLYARQDSSGLSAIEIDNEVPGVPWTNNLPSTDANQDPYHVFGEPGPTLRHYQTPSIHLDPAYGYDFLMLGAQTQELDISDGRLSDFSRSSTWNSTSDGSKGITYPSQYDGVTRDLSHCIEK